MLNHTSSAALASIGLLATPIPAPVSKCIQPAIDTGRDIALHLYHHKHNRTGYCGGFTSKGSSLCCFLSACSVVACLASARTTEAKNARARSFSARFIWRTLKNNSSANAMGKGSGYDYNAQSQQSTKIQQKQCDRVKLCR